MAKTKQDRNDKVELYSYNHKHFKTGVVKKFFRVRVVSSNGKIICSTGDGYINFHDALNVAQKLMRGFYPAQIVDLTKPEKRKSK